MTEIVFIRGAMAVGKTIITKTIIDRLKNKYNLKCAYVSEKYFGMDMQKKYNSNEECVFNTFELIKTTILKLFELDDYDFIFVEGRFRTKEILDYFQKFIEERSFGVKYYHLYVDIEEMINRNENYKHYEQRDVLSSRLDVESHIPKYFKMVNTKQNIEDSVQEIIIDLINH